MRLTSVMLSTAGLLMLMAASTAMAQFPSTIELDDIESEGGVLITGIDDLDFSGGATASIGDLNNDGIDDLAIGAPTIFFAPEHVGETYVVFGSPGEFPSPLDLATLDGTNGFTMTGLGVDDFTGFWVAGAGDVNDDGIVDLLVSAPGVDPGGRPGAGVVYVIFGASSFPASVDLSGLDGTNGFTIHGIDEDDGAGNEVAGVGDVNADGIDDIFIGASAADPVGFPSGGEAYVVYGSDAGFAATLELSALDGSNGFLIEGTGGGLGISVSGAGDVNADGIHDVIVGAEFAMVGGMQGAGQAYVLFGSDVGFPASLSVSSLDGTNGFAILGTATSDNLGGSVAGGVDVNADGIADVLMGAVSGNGPSPNRTGAAYVVYGSADPFPAAVDSALLDGMNGFTLNGIDPQDFVGRKVAMLEDVNSDGLGDLLISADGGDQPGGIFFGEAYVVYGSTSFPAVFELSSLDGTNGFTVTGSEPDQQIAFAVSSAGDVNDDGINDLMIGAPGVGGNIAGTTILIYGRPRCDQGTVNAANGFVFNSLFINGSVGDASRQLTISAGDSVDVTLLKPIAGGSGRFVMHADEGIPSLDAAQLLPRSVGLTCFPFLLTDGAMPIVVANNLGRENLVGASEAFGVPQADPERADTTFSYPPLPVGTVLTFQGIIVDPGSRSAKNASTTNAIYLTVVP